MKTNPRTCSKIERFSTHPGDVLGWILRASLFQKKEKKKKPKTKQNNKKKQQKKAGKTREMHENKKGREGRAKVLFLLIKYANFVASSLSRRRRYLEVAIVFD